MTINELTQIIPTVTFQAKDDQVTIIIDSIESVSGYEVFFSKSNEDDYSFLMSSSYHILSHYLEDKIAYYYKVRAYIQRNGEKIYTEFSIPEKVDLETYSKKRNERINNFFDSLKNISTLLTYEDLDVAIDSLKLASLEIKEYEERKRIEENAQKLKRELDLKEKRQQLKRERELAKQNRIEAERIQKITSMELPLDYENEYSIEQEMSVDSTYDALLMSLDNLGMVDIEYIASLTGEDLKTVIFNLKGCIYQNPLYWQEIFYKGWETADEYLSGNLMQKYQIAKEANEKYKGYFETNVTALEGIIEPDISVGDIYVTLGSPWVPTEIIDDFITYMAFGNRKRSKEALAYYNQCSQAKYATRHDEYTGYWEIPNKTRFRGCRFYGIFEEANSSIYGTERMEMLYILEATLNMRTISVSDTLDVNKKIKVVNQQETIKALEKQKFMIETFQNWVWQDEDRKKRLHSAYARKYGNFRARHFDGRYLELPGLNKDIKLYPYQKNAVARIISSPNTLLAHDVGAGKTYVMICAGMELRRLHKSKKNLYVVPNNIIAQWAQLFKKLYPESKVLVINNKNFGPSKRNETINRIKNEDFDGILMTYSCFDMLSPSNEFYQKLYSERKNMLDKAQSNFYGRGTLEKKIKVINDTLDKLKASYNVTPKITPFDELGINTLFVDEAHNYKNINLESRISDVRGFSNEGSTKANLMLDKVRCVQRMNNGGRVVFATGTPITNSISDIFVMQKYLQEGELFYQNINTFDAWVGMFAEKSSDFEIDVDTKSFRLITRFSRYRNIPELSATLGSITDFHQIKEAEDLPVMNGYSDSIAEGSKHFKDYLQDISYRADDIHNKRVTAKEDNMLKLTTDGRKAALDMRLIDGAFGFDPEAKVARCASNVMKVYRAHKNSTQLVFCDSSTPKQGFNLYDELKRLLVSFGMPSERIAFVHDATSDEQRQHIFDQMNNGELTLLVGSTSKMGHGMNVQKHLIAIHHLDVPWRPSDMVQREGRIIRQGNENKNINIYRYVTKGSFDAYSWQILENKQRFISQIMSGKANFREGGEIDDTVLNYAEVKALAIGNPKIKERVETLNELNRYLILQRDYVDQKQKREQIIKNMPLKIEEQKKKIENCEKDYQSYLRERIDYTSMSYQEQKEMRQRIYQAVMNNQNNPEEVEIMKYQGFRIVVPAYMIPRKVTLKQEFSEDEEMFENLTKPIPYIHLIKENTYYLEIESESGISVRLNNFFENLPELKKKYEVTLNELENKMINAQRELENNNEGFMGKISILKDKLSKLNKELGME